MKNIAIYAETGKTVGLGHLIRCSAIAEELCRKDNILFITTKGFVDENFRISNVRYTQSVSPKENEETFVFNMRNIFKKADIQVALLDSYYITQNILLELNIECKIVVFDGSSVYPLGINMIINYTLRASYENYFQRYGNKVSLAIGPKYFPLRRDIRQTKPINIIEKPKNIFVSLGGSEMLEETVEVISIVKKIDGNLDIYMVGDKILCESEVIKNDSKIHFYSNIKNVENVMKKCDIAVSAAGTTIYELLSLGIPTISFAIAENQLVNKELEDIILWCGLINKITKNGRLRIKDKNIIKNKLSFLLESYEIREKLSEQGKVFIDGLGAVRIAQMIKCLEEKNTNKR